MLLIQNTTSFAAEISSPINDLLAGNHYFTDQEIITIMPTPEYVSYHLSKKLFDDKLFAIKCQIICNNIALRFTYRRFIEIATQIYFQPFQSLQNKAAIHLMVQEVLSQTQQGFNHNVNSPPTL